MSKIDEIGKSATDGLRTQIRNACRIWHGNGHIRRHCEHGWCRRTNDLRLHGRAVGSNQWMLLLWVLGGVTALCGALTLAELSAAIPKTGGDYVYLHEAYGPLPAFLSGWVSFLIGFSAPSASAAFAAAKYVLTPFASPGPRTLLWERALATAAILTFALIHISGRKRTAGVQGWITALKLAVLGVVVLAGLSIGWPNTANLADRTPLTGRLAITMMASMVYVSYAYIGWNAASYMAGEIRDPQRLLPRAILLGTGGVLILYLLLNVVYALALTPADVLGIINDPANHEGRTPWRQLHRSRQNGCSAPRGPRP